jgi:hypothetical protein
VHFAELSQLRPIPCEAFCSFCETPLGFIRQRAEIFGIGSTIFITAATVVSSIHVCRTLHVIYSGRSSRPGTYLVNAGNELDEKSLGELSAELQQRVKKGFAAQKDALKQSKGDTKVEVGVYPIGRYYSMQQVSLPVEAPIPFVRYCTAFKSAPSSKSDARPL